MRAWAGKLASALGESRVGQWARALPGQLVNAARRLGVRTSERFAAREAARLEALDGGHSLARHGPDVSDAALDARARTGMTAGGKVSPTPNSTRFSSNRDWVQTRDAALRDVENRRGVDLSRPPASGQPLKYDVVLEHGRPIDDGFVGTGAPSKVPHPTNPLAKPIKVYVTTDPVAGLTRTRTRIDWDASAGRWNVVQHFPEADTWSQILGRYTSPPPP